MKFKLFELGMSAEMEQFLRVKVRFSNQIAVILALNGLTFALLSFLQTGTISVYPLAITAVSLLALFLNSFGQFNFSRLLLAVMIPLFFFLFHGFLIPPNSPILLPMFALQVVLAFVPWAMFSLKESLFLFFSLTACYLLLFFQSFGNDLLESGIRNQHFNLAAMGSASWIFAFVILLTIVLMLVYQEQEQEKRIEELTEDVRNGKKMLESQENELQRTLNEVTLARKEEAKRNWVNEGLANLDSLLRGNYSDDIYQRLVSFIVKHLNVNQGGIFVAEQDEQEKVYLRLAACYAFDRKKFLEKRIDKDEGLIGQAFVERDTIVLYDIPSNYINITSGLGDANPGCIVIVPMKNEEAVNGVIELASFKNLESHEIEFVEKAGMHISSFIEDFNFNHKTQVLLEKTQMQAEEMKAQEEEMKQTLEEMQSIQEEMYRKEKEYINRIATLEEVIAQEKARMAELRKYQ